MPEERSYPPPNPYRRCEDKLDEDGEVFERGICTHDLNHGVLVTDLLGEEDGPHFDHYGEAILRGIRQHYRGHPT